MFLELPGKVLRIFEAQLFGSFSDGGPADQERLGTLHDETTDVGSGRFTSQLTDEVAKVVGCNINDLRYHTRIILIIPNNLDIRRNRTVSK